MLIIFSGIDSSGKSTQIDLLLRSLREQGQRPIYLWTRGGYTPLFSRLKEILRRVSGRKVVPEPGCNPQRTKAFSRKVVRKSWLCLALLDLILVYGLQIRWWGMRGRTIICDRYLWDTLIDFRLNFPQEQVESWLLWRMLVKLSPRPDLAFLLVIPVQESISRSQQKQEPFPEDPRRLTQRATQYMSLAREGHWHVLDGCRAVPDLADEILAAVQSILRR